MRRRLLSLAVEVGLRAWDERLRPRVGAAVLRGIVRTVNGCGKLGGAEEGDRERGRNIPSQSTIAQVMPKLGPVPVLRPPIGPNKNRTKRIFFLTFCLLVSPRPEATLIALRVDINPDNPAATL